MLPSGRPGSTSPSSAAKARLAALKRNPPNPVEENRYKDMIRRLKRLLETERKNLRQVRSQYAQELQNRTELEIFLHQCIEDVKHDIGRRRKQLMSSSSGGGKATFPPVHGAGGKQAAGGGGGGDVPLASFTSADRERVMELLLSQERVISLLYAKTFPPRASSASGGGLALHDGVGGGGGGVGGMGGGPSGSGGGMDDLGGTGTSALLAKASSFTSVGEGPSGGRLAGDSSGGGVPQVDMSD